MNFVRKSHAARSRVIYHDTIDASSRLLHDTREEKKGAVEIVRRSYRRSRVSPDFAGIILAVR